jgi:ABC-type transporter Mla subunit MlaD
MNFYVNPDQLRTRGGAVEDIGTQSAGDLNALRAQTAGGAASWGTDDAGARLAALYQELTSATGEALDLLAGGLSEVGSTVRRMGDTFEQKDGSLGGKIGRAGDGGPAWP